MNVFKLALFSVLSFLMCQSAANAATLSLDTFVTDVQITSGDGVLNTDDIALVGDMLVFEFDIPDGLFTVEPNGLDLPGMHFSVNGLNFTGVNPRFNWSPTEFTTTSILDGSGSISAGGNIYTLSDACCSTLGMFDGPGDSDISLAVELIDYLLVVDTINGVITGNLISSAGGEVDFSIAYDWAPPDMTPVPLPGAGLLMLGGLLFGGRFLRFRKLSQPKLAAQV
ncbi:hypothetical protein [Hyphococcus luteus]|uniref:PEP-CTERM protein-sorting domain-containing protein n=1 Tax=Hyphococcus luteus TaxID=2058213 RepID=A0A2S7K7Z1_9PROT|nr:hypothetical protein [Marinicaulis flavus]PQA88612.1 hypothetical protein CW354_10045 [Marinicaulis flavus]